jgi:hypothetical protein
MQITIATEYTHRCETNIKLPHGKNPKDIKEVYIRWGQIFIHFKDKTVIELDEDYGEVFDAKHPNWIEISDENGETYSEVKEWLHGE